MDYKKEAQKIRERRPRRTSYNPPPIPYVGHIALIRRKDGGYLLSAMGYDDQTGQLDDGSLAAELIGPKDVMAKDSGGDRLAAALRRAHRRLARLRLEAAMRLIATLGQELEIPGHELTKILHRNLHGTGKAWQSRKGDADLDKRTA